MKIRMLSMRKKIKGIYPDLYLKSICNTKTIPKQKEALITNKNHYILKAPHPSPLSAYRGFFGSKPFSKTNEFLVSHGIEAIDWQIDEL